MHMLQSCPHMVDVFQRCVNLEHSILIQHLIDGLTGDVFHHIIGSAVFLEDLKHRHNAGMLKLGKDASFFLKLVAENAESFFRNFIGIAHATTYAITIAAALHKELLNGHIGITGDIAQLTLRNCLHLCQIRDAKPTGAKHASYLIFTILQ